MYVMSDAMDILFYDAKSPYYEFSNYYVTPVVIDGNEYISTEPVQYPQFL